MIDFKIDKLQSFASLYPEWEKNKFFPLCIRLHFKVSGKHINIDAPNGQYPQNEICKALSELYALYINRDEEAECEMLLCSRNDPGYSIGSLAVLKGKISLLIASLGWSIHMPTIDKNASIEDQLYSTGNNYWAIETAAYALGLKDLVNDEPGLLSCYPNFSIIIPGRGIHDTIELVVQSIHAAVRLLGENIKWECIIIDDANEIPLKKATPHNEHVRIIRTDNQVYCGGARNLGCQAAKYETIIFLDGDTMVSSNYIKEHLYRHLLSENLITVSLREYLTDNSRPIQDRKPDISKDTRVFAHYSPGRLGLVPVNDPIDIEAMKETNEFREFGFAHKLGPTDLPFMVKGNNLAISKSVARIGFPPDFIGYGPEDGMFAAKAISRGCFVIPVLSTGVFHINHAPRSGSLLMRDNELIKNLERMRRHLRSSAWSDWEVNSDGEKS